VNQFYPEETGPGTRYEGMTSFPSFQMSLTVRKSQPWEMSLARFIILLINNNLLPNVAITFDQHIFIF